MSIKIEQLTESERALLTNVMLSLGTKALRLLDAHAAGVAALVAQLEAAERYIDEYKRDRDAWRVRTESAEAQLEAANDLLAWCACRLSDDVDAAVIEDIRTWQAGQPVPDSVMQTVLSFEARYYTAEAQHRAAEDQAALASTRADAAEAQVAELTRERDFAHAGLDDMNDEIDSLKAEVTRLAALLEISRERRAATEAEVTRLTAELERLRNGR